MPKETQPPSLTTALHAAQARTGQQVNTRPTATNESLVRTRTEIPQIDFIAEASTAISNLETAVETYQENEDKPNMELLNARAEVNRLSAELSAAEAKLALEQQRGSFLDRLNASVLVAENRVESLRNHYQRLVTDQILRERFGQSVPTHAIGRDTRRELSLHIRITSLQKFRIPGRTLHQQITGEYVYARAEKAASTLDALKRHIVQDQADNAKK